mgnify:CR=1 FL=1
MINAGYVIQTDGEYSVLRMGDISPLRDENTHVYIKKAKRTYAGELLNMAGQTGRKAASGNTSAATDVDPTRADQKYVNVYELYNLDGNSVGNNKINYKVKQLEDGLEITLDTTEKDWSYLLRPVKQPIKRFIVNGKEQRI